MNIPYLTCLCTVALFAFTAPLHADSVVTTSVDEDNGLLGGGTGVSLREAVKYSPDGTLVTFAAGLSGQTITLTSGEMLIVNNVTVDATALPGGLTVDGANITRHFRVNAGKSLSLLSLTLSRGNSIANVGGSILNNGTLVLSRCSFNANTSTYDGGTVYSSSALQADDCTFSENRSGTSGGGISANGGTVALNRCTLFNNTAGTGGAIYQQGVTSIMLSHCTVVANASTASFSSGGITVYDGNLDIKHCTISQNSGSGLGGGIFQHSAVVNIQYSIIAGNSDRSGSSEDFYFNSGTLNTIGMNFIGELAGSSLSASSILITGDPRLSPLGYFGGAVQTMHPLTDSPVIDRSSLDPLGTDARGFPRFIDSDASGTAQLDLGAVEAGPRVTVTTPADEGGPDLSGPISVREAIAHAPSQSVITFTPALSGLTCTLSGGQIFTGKSIFLDASSLTAPFTISGNNVSRVFHFGTTANVALHSLKIINGRTSNGVDGLDGFNGANGTNGANGVFGFGGADGADGAPGLPGDSGTQGQDGDAGTSGGDGFVGGVGENGSSGTHGSSGGDGGGILNAGSLSLFACTVSNNSTGDGGDGGNGGEGGFGGSGGDGGEGGGGGNGGSGGDGGNNMIGGFGGDGGNGGSGGDGGSGGNGGDGGSGGFGGFGGNGGSGGSGGGISSSGPLSLTACTLANNTTGSGSFGGAGGIFGVGGVGGIGGYGGDSGSGGVGGLGGFGIGGFGLNGNVGSNGLFGLNGSNGFAGNSGFAGYSGFNGNGGDGGGISCSGPLILTSCTLFNNATGSGGSGGGVSSSGSLRLTACTLASNTAVSGYGGGVFSFGLVTLEYCIVAHNTGYLGLADDVNVNSLTYVGANLLSTVVPSAGITGPSPTIADPMLAPLSDYGGPTFTMLPLPGSPAINAAIGSTAITDQRGLPMNGIPDIGAVENQVARMGFIDTDSDGMDDRLEVIYRFNVGVPDGGLDADGDGSTNRDELGNMTGPRDPSSLLKILTFSRNGNSLNVNWTSFPGLSYTLEYGDTLNFGNTIALGAANGMTSGTAIGPFFGPRIFMRVRRD